MENLKQSDMVWNRACGTDPLRSLPGDRALVGLLRAHGLTMNGGVLHAVECLSANDLSAAESGFRYFGLDPIANLLRRAKTVLDEGRQLEFHEAEFDRQYASIIPSDCTLLERFEQSFKLAPADYAPLGTNDIAS